MKYIFTSNRLGFRAWENQDIDVLLSINQDKEVMRFFPKCPSATDTQQFIAKMQTMQAEKGYCYFAVDELATGHMIGFIGICNQTYEADFTPCVDIGWRLAKQFWNKGYATEGAKRCLAYAKELGITEIVSVAPIINEPSIHVMKKIGMQHIENFEHPLLSDYPRIEECVLYRFVL